MTPVHWHCYKKNPSVNFWEIQSDHDDNICLSVVQAKTQSGEWLSKQTGYIVWSPRRSWCSLDIWSWLEDKFPRLLRGQKMLPVLWKLDLAWNIEGLGHSRHHRTCCILLKLSDSEQQYWGNNSQRRKPQKNYRKGAIFLTFSAISVLWCQWLRMDLCNISVDKAWQQKLYTDCGTQKDTLMGPQLVCVSLQRRGL